MSHKTTGCIFGYEVSELITIDAADQYHGVTGLGADGCNNGTEEVTSLKGSITDTYGAAGGELSCVDAGHGLTTGDYISLTGMGDAAHVGLSVVTVTDASNFIAEDITYNSSGDTGTWTRGSGIKVEDGHGGVFSTSCTGSILSSGVNKNFRFELAKNATEVDESVAERKFANATDLGAISFGGLITLSGGDVLWVIVKGTTDATNVTVEHMNLHIVRV